jgi:hypothetical protein
MQASASVRRGSLTACTFEVVVDLSATPGRIRKTGFSRKIRDANARRLFLDELARQHGLSRIASGREIRTIRNAHAHSRAMPRARDPLISFDDVTREFSVALARAAFTFESAQSWDALMLQTRISRLEQGTSTSPERQVANIVAWCVQHRFRPVALVHEEVSGAIFRKRRRVHFERAFDDIEHDRILNPVDGEPIKHIACFLFERFTRDPDEGGDWLRLLRRKGINLYETYYGDEPEPLYRVEHTIRDAWNRAAKEVERDRERIVNSLEALARRGLPTYGTDTLFGHTRVVDPTTNKTVGYRADTEAQAIIEARARDLIGGASLHAVQCWLNDNGVRNACGGQWTHAATERLFRAPRLAGLVRLRTDRSRLHDESYKGALYPQELIYEEGEEPPAEFDAPIEPLIPYPLWRDLQEVLDRRKRKHGPHAKRFASGKLTCSECRDRLIGGTRKGVLVYRCAKRHLNGKTRSKAHMGAKIADDGKRHPVVTGEPTDRLIEELIFAAIDRDIDPTEAIAAIDVTKERERLQQQLRVLDERQGNLSHMLFEQRITRDRYDEWSTEIDIERAVLRRELSELAREPAAQLPAHATLRDLWEEMPLERRRQWIEIVFDKIVVKPAPNIGSLELGLRFELEFRKGYEPPPAEVAELVAQIENDYRRHVAPNRVSEAIEERIYALYLEGNSTLQIGAILRSEGAATPQGGKWGPTVIANVLTRACRERGLEYVPNHRDRSHIPRETRELMHTLFVRLLSFAAVGRELNLLGLRRPGGGLWDSNHTRCALLRFAKTTGVELPRPIKSGPSVVRPTHLSPAMRETIWRMRRREGKTLSAIAAWLKRRGIETAGGRAEWSLSTIHAIVAAVDRQKADELARLEPAA